MNIILRAFAIFSMTFLCSCVVALGNESACKSCEGCKSCEVSEEGVMNMQCCIDAAALGQECADCTGK